MVVALILRAKSLVLLYVETGLAQFVTVDVTFQDKIGLLTRENLGQFFTIWKDLVDRKQPKIPQGTRRVRIRSVTSPLSLLISKLNTSFFAIDVLAFGIL